MLLLRTFMYSTVHATVKKNLFVNDSARATVIKYFLEKAIS